MLHGFRLTIAAFVFAAIGLGASSVQADEDTTLEDFAWKRTTIVRQLIENDCVTQVGDLDLRKLLQDLEQVVFYINHGKTISGSGGNRSTAVNFTEEKAVVINAPSSYDLKRWNWRVILLHEGLGALGYDDEDYQLSAALEWLHTQNLYIDDVQARRAYANSGAFKHFRNLERRKHNKIYVADGGGSTSTGSGGDLIPSLLKWGMLTEVKVEDEFRRTYRRPDGSQLAPRYPGMTVEQLEALVFNLRIEERQDDPSNRTPSVSRDADGRIILWVPKGEKVKLPPGRTDNFYRFMLEEVLNEMKKGAP